MGDTGSLALGGLLGGLAIMTRTELLLVILGGLFVVETLSVIIQVAAFKTMRRRVFNMAPIHHHFELAGWAENTVIVRFWIIAGLAVAFGLGAFYAEFLSHGPLRMTQPDWSQLRVCVAGLGVSGAAATRVLLDRGARVLVVDAADGDREQRRRAELRCPRRRSAARRRRDTGRRRPRRHLTGLAPDPAAVRRRTDTGHRGHRRTGAGVAAAG